MTSNTAAYLVSDKAPLEVKPASYPEPKEYEIVVKSHAVAINPVDYAQQLFGPALFTWLKFPSILGYDVSGEVEALGSRITKFKVGDRVAALANGTFQHYVLAKEHCVTKVPSSITFEEAAVMPLCLSVAVKALFHPEYLALGSPARDPKPTGKVVLIWGGSTSVGCNALQLAKAAGYEVITTASPKSFEYVKKLGASQVYDYNNPSVKNELLEAVRGKTVAGAIANGGMNPEDYPSIVEICAAVALSSSENCKLIPLTMVPRFPIPEGIEAKFVMPLEADRDLASSVFNDYLPGALADGSFIPAPTPKVAGTGLEAIQGAMDMLREGVSAKKIVVRIDGVI